MNRDHQRKWDLQHARSPGRERPAGFLRQVLETEAWHLGRGRALDLACGQGSNALFLAKLGFEVVAMDISAVALAEGRRRAEEKNLSVDWRRTDLEQTQLDEAAYDLIINFNYLQRSLMAQLKRAVKRGGHIVVETYLIDQIEIGHPSNADYLLAHNELLEMFRDFRVLYYREGRFPDGSESSFRAGILAQRPRGMPE